MNKQHFKTINKVPITTPIKVVGVDADGNAVETNLVVENTDLALGGDTGITVVEIDSATVTSYTVDVADIPIFLDIDTTTADVTINLPTIVDGSEIYVRNRGGGIISMVPNPPNKLENVTTFDILEGEFYHFLGDTDDWTTIMKSSTVLGTATYFYGFYDDLATGTLFLETINLNSSSTIDYLKYNMYYLLNGDTAMGTTTEIVINNISTPNITVTV